MDDDKPPGTAFAAALLKQTLFLRAVFPKGNSFFPLGAKAGCRPVARGGMRNIYPASLTNEGIRMY